ncbi:HNH endonuclease [Thermoanaerobacterium sp. DL9XJH110]|uniref:HNH endonuclease n=1 Tax=Thermoanaerobacterium sp. DL9XJH110 TaxID=3386643 RepID=UPI003BB5970B
MPYNKRGYRYWLSLGEYRKLYPNDFIFYPIPDYRKDSSICKWCGRPLKNKRQSSLCSKDCRVSFKNLTVWHRGIAPLPYRILCRDNFTCQDCGRFLAYRNQYGMYIPVGVDLEVHHIIPVCEGGTDHQNNLKTLCRECHLKKHSINLVKGVLL